MKFNLWVVVALALMPAFVMFVGMSAAGAFRSPVDWDVMALFGAAAVFAAWRAGRWRNGGKR